MEIISKKMKRTLKFPKMEILFISVTIVTGRGKVRQIAKNRHVTNPKKEKQFL